MIKTNSLQQSQCFLLRLRIFFQLRWKHHVLERSKTTQQLKSLKHKPYLVASGMRALLLVHRGDFIPTEKYLALSWIIETRQQTQHCGFS